MLQVVSLHTVRLHSATQEIAADVAGVTQQKQSQFQNLLSLCGQGLVHSLRGYGSLPLGSAACFSRANFWSGA